jgi:hypothetical protein
MIGPDGLLLVVFHLFAVPVLISWAEFGRKKKLNLNVRNVFAGSHTEHCWSCS